MATEQKRAEELNDGFGLLLAFFLFIAVLSKSENVFENQHTETIQHDALELKPSKSKQLSNPSPTSDTKKEE